MRRVLVTGASKGIGQAIALRLAQSDFYVYVHYHQDKIGAEKTLEQVIHAGGAGQLIQFDVSNRTQCAEQLQFTLETEGVFYGIVNNAGICKDGPFPIMTDEDWDSVIHTNLDSFYNVIRPCVLPMIQARQGGRIVALTSVSGIAGNRGQVNYSAAKAGIIGAAKALALELAKRNITVNCVAPGLIETDMVGELPHLEEMLRSIPCRRTGKAAEVAGLVNYLMSDEAAYITRQVISINGGLL
jgi:3-oxoacyl-[acyl-carrier protein] reductase